MKNSYHAQSVPLILDLQPIPGDPKDNGVAAMLDGRTFCFVTQHGRHVIVFLYIQGLVANQEYNRFNDSPAITNATVSNRVTVKSDDLALQPKMFSSSFLMLARVKVAFPADESPIKVPLTRLTYLSGAGGLNGTIPVWSRYASVITSFTLFFLSPQFTPPVSPNKLQVNVTVDP